MAMNPDLMLQGERASIVREIESEENKERKAESLRRFEVFNDRQDKYIQAKLRQEFQENEPDMRKVLSVNISKRIINEQASIYKREPMRHFGNASEREYEQIENIYHYGKVNQSMDLANAYFKLYNEQVLMSVLPRDGVLEARPMIPYNYDVIPDYKNPEKPFAVVINVYDKYDDLQSYDRSQDIDKLRGKSTSLEPNGINQKIADADDYKALSKRYIVWTKDFNFIMNGKGQLIDVLSPSDVLNPIGRLPFIDISEAKSHEFYRRYGSNIVDFTIEFGVMLSDLANISRLQSYAQAVVVSEKRPEAMVLGPMNTLWLKDSKNPDVKSPTFQFVSPSPDLNGALSILETQLRIFLSAQGIDTNAVTGTLNAKSATSGIERLLNMVERFEASKSDIAHFRSAESELFELFKDWSNAYQGVRQEEGGLIDDLKISSISDSVTFEIEFKEPEMIQTKEDREASVQRRLDMGLITKKMALMELEGMDEDQANELIEEIENEKIESINKFKDRNGKTVNETSDERPPEDKSEG